MMHGAARRAAACAACLLALAGSSARGAKVFVTGNANEADLAAFRTGQANEADLHVYDGPGACMASGAGRWCYVQNQNEADVRVHFTESPDLADLKVWFVENASEAGWFRPPHDIVSSPRDTGAFPGRSASMRVRAFLPLEAQYQWQRLVGDSGWVDIPGATGGSLSLAGDDPEALGAYRVRVWSERGTLFSRAALFRVLSLPRFEGAERGPGGLFRMVLAGEPGFPYVVEASDDFTYWFVVGEVDGLAQEGATVEDAVSPAVERRIYRIRVQE